MSEVVGKYTLDNMFNGNYRVLIKHQDYRHSFVIPVHELEKLLDQYTFYHTDHCLQTFKLAFDNPEKFLETEDKKIIDSLTQSEVIPGVAFPNEHERWLWHLSQWIVGYNRCYDTNLTLDFVLTRV